MWVTRALPAVRTCSAAGPRWREASVAGGRRRGHQSWAAQSSPEAAPAPLGCERHWSGWRFGTSWVSWGVQAAEDCRCHVLCANAGDVEEMSGHLLLHLCIYFWKEVQWQAVVCV